jgi:biopolymer transport protein ExbD
MRIASPRSSRRARIEIIPLIDVIFFLLATFMVVSLSMIANHGIPVHLPPAATATSRDRSDAATIAITAEGGIYFDKEPVDLEGLAARLRQLRASAVDPRVLIRGDEGARFGAVVRVLDEVRGQDIGRVSIETGARPPGAAP